MNLFIILWALCAILEWYTHTDIIEKLNTLQIIYVAIIVILFSPFMLISDFGLFLLDTIIGDDYDEY